MPAWGSGSQDKSGGSFGEEGTFQTIWTMRMDNPDRETGRTGTCRWARALAEGWNKKGTGPGLRLSGPHTFWSEEHWNFKQ